MKNGTVKNITPRQIRSLNKLTNHHFQYAETNSINSEENNIHYGYSDDEVLEEFKDILVEFKVLSKTHHVCNVNYLDLKKVSVAPHSDEHFSESHHAKKAFVIVLGMNTTANVSDEISDKSIHLYHSRQWTSLVEGSYTSFDPSKEHALINNWNTKLLVVWI
jgi:hypothetical protein